MLLFIKSKLIVLFQTDDDSDNSSNSETPSPTSDRIPKSTSTKPDNNSEKENNFEQTFQKSEKLHRYKRRSEKMQENLNNFPDAAAAETTTAQKRRRSGSESMDSSPKKEEKPVEKLVVLESTPKVIKKHKKKKNIFENKCFKNKKSEFSLCYSLFKSVHLTLEL